MSGKRTQVTREKKFQLPKAMCRRRPNTRDLSNIKPASTPLGLTNGCVLYLVSNRNTVSIALYSKGQCPAVSKVFVM